MPKPTTRAPAAAGKPFTLPVKGLKPALTKANGTDTLAEPESDAASIWARCVAATAKHGYLKRKQGTLAGLRVVDAKDAMLVEGWPRPLTGNLVIPLHSISTGALLSLQFIPERGDKMTLPGSMGDGAFVVGELGAGATVYVVEGIGQAWACNKATGSAAVVAFGVGRMRTVAHALHKRDARMKLVIVPDAGAEEVAEAVATELGCGFVRMPEGSRKNYDINDLLVEHGHDRVATVLENVRQQPPPIRAKAKPGLKSKEPPLPETALNIKRVKAALKHLDAAAGFGERQQWLIVLMSLHSLGWASGFDLALWWSEEYAGNFKSAADVRKQWDSLDHNAPTGEPRTVGSIFFAAKELGWVDDAAASKKPEAIAAAVEIDDEDPLAAFDIWHVTEKFVESIKATQMVHAIIAQSHLAVWAGPSGAGKTAVAMHMAGVLSAQGLKVFYFQEDAGQGDLPAMQAHAERHGYKMLSSSVALGSGTDDQLDLLCALRDTGRDLSGVVLIFDTMKKYLDLMSKSGAREFFKLARALTTSGSTVILLGHTNKSVGADGKPIFEGVGDVRNDVDELLYFQATTKDINGEVTVTATPDKVRCLMPRAVSFVCNVETREVRELERPIDVAALRERERQEAEDAPVLVLFKTALKAKPAGINSTELVDTVSRQTSAMSSRQVFACFERHCTASTDNTKALMLETKGLHNARVIKLNPKASMNRAGGFSQNAGTARTAGTAETAQTELDE